MIPVFDYVIDAPPRAISAIVESFGGVRAMARAIGMKNNSTVQYWKDAGHMPRRMRGPVVDALVAHGIFNRTEADAIVSDAVIGR